MPRRPGHTPHSATQRGGQKSSARAASPHAKDEVLRVKVGDAFDIVTERKQRIPARRPHPTVSLRDHSPHHKDVPVEVVFNERRERMEGSPRRPAARIAPRCAGLRMEKTSVTGARLRVPVERDGETKVSYRIRVKY